MVGAPPSPDIDCRSARIPRHQEAPHGRRGIAGDGRREQAGIDKTLASFSLAFGVPAMLAITAVVTPWVFDAALGWPFATRVVAVRLLAPLGIVLGMPFPTGLCVLSDEASTLGLGLPCCCGWTRDAGHRSSVPRGTTGPSGSTAEDGNPGA
jgi:hypothetical protein